MIGWLVVPSAGPPIAEKASPPTTPSTVTPRRGTVTIESGSALPGEQELPYGRLAGRFGRELADAVPPVLGDTPFALVSRQGAEEVWARVTALPAQTTVLIPGLPAPLPSPRLGPPHSFHLRWHPVSTYSTGNVTVDYIAVGRPVRAARAGEDEGAKIVAPSQTFIEEGEIRGFRVFDEVNEAERIKVVQVIHRWPKPEPGLVSLGSPLDAPLAAVIEAVFPTTSDATSKEEI